MKDNYISWEEAVCRLRVDQNQQDLVRHCYYDDPIQDAAERYAQSDEWQGVLDLLSGKIPSTVLDIGAGRGISSYAFAKSGCEVVALEPDSSPIVGSGAIRELIARTGVNIKICEEKGERLPFPDDSFDVVYGRAVFHHISELRRFCAEACRVLRSDGIFLMTREHVITRKKDLQTFFDSHPLHYLYGGENAFLLDEYISAIKSANMTVMKVLGPFETAANYAPMTDAEFRKMAGRFLLGLGRALIGIPAVLRWRQRSLTRRCEAPGRLYTFMAKKS